MRLLVHLLGVGLGPCIFCALDGRILDQVLFVLRQVLRDHQVVQGRATELLEHLLLVAGRRQEVEFFIACLSWAQKVVLLSIQVERYGGLLFLLALDLEAVDQGVNLVK